MIIAHAPLRMSFVGGGSDLPSYYREHGGAVVSATLDRYVYVAVKESFDGMLRLGGEMQGSAERAGQLQHPRVREALQLLGIEDGLDLVSMSDVPAQGTGLGSSGSFTVALLHALHAHQGRQVEPESLARQACHVELERLGEPIGKQDQYASAYGGLNLIEFHADERVSVHPVACRPEVLAALGRRLLTFYTGITRSASAMLQGQNEAIRTRPHTRDSLGRMVELAYQMKRELETGHLEGFGALLDANWQLKRELSRGISTTEIDEWYERARKAGALGGKLLGAGGGGFLLFDAPEERHPAIIQALPGLRRVPLRLQPQGSTITRIRQGVTP
ncbi:sugar kinase [Archangium violaceum]|uniref:GHMP family kinase ATP-binding protein n=1 Tax=Archangium violaceum TaxID=83451 RepID=UPI00195002AD|nr:sugar kinase [Archangium violaceum]QRN99078.1 sugar kinase [Archangium violaceum]